MELGWSWGGGHIMLTNKLPQTGCQRHYYEDTITNM
jgi:hypothetical protein